MRPSSSASLTKSDEQTRVLTQLLGWIALAIGWTGTAFIPRSRHAWLIGVAALTVWTVVDARLNLWSGVAAGVIGAALNTRCWARHVTGTPTPTSHPRDEATDEPTLRP